MKTSFLYSTALLLLIGGGAAIAQSPDISQKREESPRAQTPAAQSPAAQSEQKGGAKEMRGEAPKSSERSKQAQEPQGRDSKEPTRQSQDQPAQPSRERAPSSTAQQKDGQQDRDEKQSADEKQQAKEKLRSREGQPKQDRAQDTNKPTDTKQQQTQQQTDRDRKDSRDQSARPSGTSTQQQMSRRGDTAPSQKAGQAPDQSNSQRTSATVNDDQRRQIVDQLRRDKRATSQNLNIEVNIGTRLPPRVQARRLPSDIVGTMPQYRDYQYTVIDNRVAIIDPRGRKVVEILDDGPDYGRTAAYSRDRIVISDHTRTRFRELVRNSSATVGSTSPSGGGTSALNCLSLQPVPEELVRTHPELNSYRYLAIGEQVVLVDPQQQKIVQVID